LKWILVEKPPRERPSAWPSSKSQTHRSFAPWF
jgi:hypothetical protein